MAYQSFRDFLGALARAGEMVRFTPPIGTELEITVLADCQMKSAGGGKALLIEQPTVGGRISPFPVAINTMGSQRRMAMALGADSVDTVATQIASLVQARPPTSFRDAIGLLSTAMDLRHTRTKTVRHGPCQEVIHWFDPAPKRTEPWPPAASNLQGATEVSNSVPTLLDLPILKCWPLDGGRFITLPCVVSKDPDTGARNVGMYRMQVYDSQTTGMHWQLQKVGARHARRYHERGERMPVAVFLGGDPACTFAATAPLPDGLDEFLFAGYLRRRSVELVRCVTCDLEVPADADFVIEGYIDPEEPLREEGPFGDHTGFYAMPELYPVFHVTAVTHRKDAVYPATIVGKPPMEDFHIGSATVRLFLPIFKMTFPEIVDIAMPAEGVFHNLVFVSIRKTYPMQAYKIMHGLWGMGQMMFSKYIVVVDDDVDVQNTSEVLFRLCANTDPQRDCLFTRGPADVLDHATPETGIGSKLGFDATRKVPGEGLKRLWPPLVRMDDAVKSKVEQMLAKSPPTAPPNSV